jgi:hypothetical protein
VHVVVVARARHLALRPAKDQRRRNVVERSSTILNTLGRPKNMKLDQC